MRHNTHENEHKKFSHTASNKNDHNHHVPIKPADQDIYQRIHVLVCQYVHDMATLKHIPT